MSAVAVGPAEATRADPSSRRSGGGRARRRRSAQDRPRFLWAFVALVGVFLAAPVVVVVVFSFNSASSTSSFAEPSLHWYRTLASDSNVLGPIRVSLLVAAVTMVIASLVGTLLALGLARTRSRRFTAPIQGVLLLTLVTPEVATGVALFLLFYALHINLSTLTIIAGHVAFSIVFVVVLIRTRLLAIPPSREEAALDLGATKIQAIALVILPEIWPAVVGAALLTFVFSFDDFITSYFLSGVGTNPLPVFIYSALKFGITPEINAVGTLMIAISVILAVVAILALRVRDRATPVVTAAPA